MQNKIIPRGNTMAKDKVSLTPDKISDKWNRRMKGSISDIQAGIDSVTESPMIKAVEKQDKLRAKWLASIDDGVWAKGMEKVTLSDWKTATKKKVGERLASGVDGAMPKRKEFDTWLVSRLNAVLPKIKDMPDMTLEDSVARVRTLMEHMSAERYKKS